MASEFFGQPAHGGDDMNRIEEMIKELSSELQQEVLDFAEFLNDLHFLPSVE